MLSLVFLFYFSECDASFYGCVRRVREKGIVQRGGKRGG
jgi:hypothetical protein